MIFNLCVLYDVSELYDNILKDKSFETALATSGSIPPLRLTLSPPSASLARQKRQKIGPGGQRNTTIATLLVSLPARLLSVQCCTVERSAKWDQEKKRTRSLEKGREIKGLKRGLPLTGWNMASCAYAPPDCGGAAIREGQDRSLIPPSAPPKLEMMVDLDYLNVFFMPGFKK